MHDENQSANQMAGKLGEKQADNEALGDSLGKASVAEKQIKTEQEQARQAWLNQIPDNPGLFLQRKFDYQYKTQLEQTEKTTEADKIW